MIEIKDEGEIILLGKLISYVKFKSTDDESAYIACSPFINSLSDKVVEELKKIGLGGKNAPDRLLLKNYEKVKSNVIDKLKNHPTWTEIDHDLKKKLVINVAYPYETLDLEINEIIDEIDKSFN